MKILNAVTILSCFIIFSTLTSCVTTSKYKAIENSLLASETELLNSRRQINDLRKDTLQQGALYRLCLKQKTEVEEYNQYSESHLFKRLNRLQADLDEKDGTIIQREDRLKQTKDELEQKDSLLRERSTKLNAMQMLLVEQNKSILDLRFMVAEAITGFGEESPLIDVREGKVFISIKEEALFRSGSTRVRSSGEVGLLQLANTFTSRPDIRVTVIGHTTSKKPSGYKDNWDFSTRRATSVTQVLIKGGILPTRITSSGKAEFEPISQLNEGEGNDLNNSRIEIVLSPDMTKLYKLLNMN